MANSPMTNPLIECIESKKFCNDQNKGMTLDLAKVGVQCSLISNTSFLPPAVKVTQQAAKRANRTAMFPSICGLRGKPLNPPLNYLIPLFSTYQVLLIFIKVK